MNTTTSYNKRINLALVGAGMLMMIAQPMMANDLVKGQKVYETNCMACHGKTGKGDGPAGKALTPHPRNFTAPDFSLTPAQMQKTVRDGKPGTAMPSWKGMLSEADIANVVHYINKKIKSK